MTMIKKDLLSLNSLLILSLSLFISASEAQSGISGALTGTILDSSGASVVSAKITATDVNTKVVRTGETDSNGRYLLSQISPGTYQITAASPGVSTAPSEATPV